MEIEELLQKQKELDALILDNAGLKEYPLESMKLALMVEIGELANEWQGFKHWKKQKTINRYKLLEEFADCFAFALSLENELHQMTPFVINNINEIIEKLDVYIENKDLLEGFKYSFESVINTNGEFTILLTVIGLGRCLDISLDDMTKAYLAKSKVNYQRQQQGY